MAWATCELWRPHRMPPPTGEGGGHASAASPPHSLFLHSNPRAHSRPHHWRRCWPPCLSRLVGPGSTGRGPSLPAPKSPTLSGQGTRQPGPSRCSSREGRGPLLGGSPPGSWAFACVRLDPLARPTDASGCLHASRALRDLTCTPTRRGRVRSGELSPPGGWAVRGCVYGQTALRSAGGQGRAWPVCPCRLPTRSALSLQKGVRKQTKVYYTMVALR